jgi:hexosaminidase
MVLLYSPAKAQTNLIPKLAEVHVLGDTVLVPKTITIAGPYAFREATELLKTYAAQEFGLEVTAGNKASAAFAILFSEVENRWQSAEGYEIMILPAGIWVEAATDQGAHRAVQTIRQLLLLAPKKEGQPVLFAQTISDEPAFAHRGFLLDCSRHFFSVGVVKKYIDLLAFYKMNTLHWHLTEDQGWRIEIEKYPKLTEVGAWRTEKDGSRYGGFYTKAEIRDVVAFAGARGVNIIPEIEMPGHAQAALASYPHLSCTGDTSIVVANDWGVFKEIYCAGNDSVFTFLEDVLTEVMELFPSKYIHIGGDEAPKFRWENCPKCQKRMADKGLKDEHELQSYFITRIEKFLNKNGRQLIGWDEILEGGLSPNATVQSWRGMEHGLTAARDSHNVIMSPTSHCYIDYNLRSINLEKVYSLNPIPEGLEKEFAQYILGGEVNMWTEHVPNDSVLDSKVFPRLIALAEVLWSGPGGDYDDFYNRLQNHYPILKSMGVKYGLEAEPIALKTFVRNDSTFVQLTPGSKNFTLEYSICHSINQVYTKPFLLNCTGNVWVRALKNGVQYGDTVQIPVSKHLALGKAPKYTNTFSRYYPASGDFGLTDGLTGTLDFHDGRWQGFSGDDLEVTIDLGAEKQGSSIGLNFYEYGNAWILAPEWVTVFTSEDGVEWESWGDRRIEINRDGAQKKIVPVQYTLAGLRPLRYVKIVAKNRDVLPEWHEAAGSEAWLFVDEIIVK